jgi:hypothetical protein
MTNLSPAAQAVLDASNLLPGRDSYLILAAALRAAADQVSRSKFIYTPNLLAIADELEGIKPTSEGD